jgi:hypothetical protein
LICLAVIAASALTAQAGSIFLSGHDPIWHAGSSQNSEGARHLATIGIEFARQGSSKPFLFIESKFVRIPVGNAFEAPFLTSALGYSPGDYTVADAAELSALPDFRLALDDYSAIVIASDHGGMLTGAELSFLNSRGTEIIDYLNDGGGLAAFAESDATGLLGETPRFGFLPFINSQVDDEQDREEGNVITEFGAGLGLLNSDVNGNFSHNIFMPVAGMEAVDLRDGDPGQILSLAFRGSGISSEGIIPEGSTIWGVLGLALGIGLEVWRRRRA